MKEGLSEERSKIGSETKVCSRCKERKPVDDFGNNRCANDGRNWYCRECAREMGHESFRRKYQYTFDKYGNKCALCQTTEKLHIHHINKKSQEGPDDLILVCKDCHLKHCHGGKWMNRRPMAQILASANSQPF